MGLCSKCGDLVRDRHRIRLVHLHNGARNDIHNLHAQKEFPEEPYPYFRSPSSSNVPCAHSHRKSIVELGSIYLGSVAMVGLMILMLEHLYKQRMVDSPTRAYFLVLMSLMAVMMAGLFLWIIQGSELLFVSSILAEMVLYFNAALAQSSFKRTPVSASARRSLG